LTALIRAVLDTSALRHNLQVLKARAPRVRVLAVIKANAYGHGLVATAHALAAADAFAVARLEEALQLREAGIKQPIVLLEGVFDAAAQALALQHQLECVVHQPEQIALLKSLPPSAQYTVWLKIDTGMNRLGFRPESAAEALDALESLQPAPRQIRLMTHLACADEGDASMNDEQLKRFVAVTATKQNEYSIANSAAVLTLPASKLGHWIRPGLALYGVSPFANSTGRDWQLKPAMRLESTVIAVRNVMKNETVGYGATWRADQNTRVAIVAAGYGDGLPRNLPVNTPVLINGQRAAIVGRVSMDMSAVAIAEGASVHLGDKVILWGDQFLSVEEIACYAEILPYELLCKLTARVAR
jgi:alanine racemase